LLALNQSLRPDVFALQLFDPFAKASRVPHPNVRPRTRKALRVLEAKGG